MDLSAINKIGKPEPYLPVKKLSELVIEKEYIITKMKTSQTKWGARVTVDLQNEFTCFLPSRFAEAFEKDDKLFQQMITCASEQRLTMVYYGTKFNHIEFKEVPA